MKRVIVGEEEEEDDDLLDDGWVQRDEQKDQLNRRLKRTGYGRWRKSLDAATRYELEREKANMTVSIEVDDDYDAFQKRRRDQATSGSNSTSTTSSPLSSCKSSFSASSSPSLISSRESSSGVLPSPSSAPGSSSSSSSSFSPPSFSLTSSKSTSSAGWVTGGRTNTRAQQRRSIGATRAHELERALEREAQAVAGDELTTQHRKEEENELQHNNDNAKEKKSSKTKTKSKEKGHTEKKKKQGSKLLFWKKGKSEADETADQPTKTRGEEEEGSAVPERERSGTMDLYAAMGSGYHKQHLALGQQ